MLLNDKQSVIYHCCFPWSLVLQPKTFSWTTYELPIVSNMSFFYYCIANWLTLTLYNHNSGKRAYLYGTNFSFSYSCHSFNLAGFSKKEVPALKCNSMAKKIFEWNTTFVFEYNNLCICHISNTICIGRKCFSDFRRKMMARTFCISPFTFGYFSSLILWCCESHYVGKL